MTANDHTRLMSAMPVNASRSTARFAAASASIGCPRTLRSSNLRENASAAFESSAIALLMETSASRRLNERDGERGSNALGDARLDFKDVG